MILQSQISWQPSGHL